MSYWVKIIEWIERNRQSWSGCHTKSGVSRCSDTSPEYAVFGRWGRRAEQVLMLLGCQKSLQNAYTSVLAWYEAGTKFLAISHRATFLYFTLNLVNSYRWAAGMLHFSLRERPDQAHSDVNRLVPCILSGLNVSPMCCPF